MDRRAFLTGVGTIGAVSAASWSAFDTQARGARASALAMAAGASSGARGKATGGAGQATLPHGLTLGYLPGSPGLLDYAAHGRRWDHFASQMRWATWHSSLVIPSYDTSVDVSIGRLASAQVHSAPGLVRSLEVTAHFALEGTLQVAPYPAWKHESAAVAKRGGATSPLTFEAGMPDRVSLQVNYAFERADLAAGIAPSGMVYIPLGARDGPGVGLYVLASPSRVTGALPDLREYRFSGDLISPLLRDTGGTPDFDYVPLTIVPVTA